MKKGQIEGIVYTLIVIIVVGFLLAWFAPLISTLADDAYDVSEPDAIFGRIILIALSPLAWVFYVLLSVIIIYFALQGGGGGL